ncbi:hypothetical protein [Natronorubrum halophilum]|uniref:hypothetical protein n=1 Tax=Natronorubrum halophilum TaxID=1702106 RepID=UPI0010C16922|nr:hypothetical protein [Natronorubrum halophilum]
MPSSTDPHEFGDAGLIAHFLVNYFGLFVAVGVGWFLWRAGTAMLNRGMTSPALEGGYVLFGLAATTVGIALVLAGIAASAYKLLAETNADATE